MTRIKNYFTLLLLFSSYMLSAQTAESIIEKYMENTGGREAWSKITSMKSIGSVKAQGLDFPTVMLSKGNKQKLTFTFQGKEIVQPAFDGQEGWQTNFMTMKAEKMEAEDSEMLKAEYADFPEVFLKYKEKGYTAELQGSETIEGTDCFKVKLTKKPIKIDGQDVENASFYFFDKENYVPILVKSEIKKGLAKGKFSETYMSDYQETNGLILPFSMDQKFEGQVQASIKMNTIEFNVEIDDKVFSFPEQ
jgi:outer membrane lipoprotein-sorting protein